MNRLLFCGVLLGLGTRADADAILSIAPATKTVTVGSPASFTINISGLASGAALGTYDINLAFDPTLLSFANIAFGNQLDVLGLGDIQSVTQGNGTVEIFELSLDSAADLNSLQATSFTLATLSFDTLALGANSPVTLSINALGDAFGNSIDASIQNGTVTIGDVSTSPEPGTFILSGTILLFFITNPRIGRRGPNTKL